MPLNPFRWASSSRSGAYHFFRSERCRTHAASVIFRLRCEPLESFGALPIDFSIIAWSKQIQGLERRTPTILTTSFLRLPVVVFVPEALWSRFLPAFFYRN